MSSPVFDAIIPLLRHFAAEHLPGLSQAADTALKLHAAVQKVRSEKAEYNKLATNACELLYVAADEHKTKGQKTVDNDLVRRLSDLTGVMEKILELAQTNADRSVFSLGAWWNSDANNLDALRGQLEQRLPQFGIRSFTDLQYKANECVQAETANATTVTNSGSFVDSILSHIHQGNDGTVNQGNNYGNSMFGGASDFKIHGSEFNNVARDMNKMTFQGKNVAPNFGQVGNQDFS